MSDQAPESGLQITFKSEGSVMFDVGHVGRVYPLQMIAVAAYLETIGKAMLLEMREMSKVAVPRTPEPRIVLPGQG